VNNQQCSVAGLILSWAGYVAGVAFFVWQRNWTGALAWLILVPLVRWILFRNFPAVSRFFGYGRVDDQLPSKVTSTPLTVTFYSFFSCPFCPIVLRRLEALKPAMGFTLQCVDVSLKPAILSARKIRSVPVVEAGGARLVGNATSEQLAVFIARALRTA
jgi:hypothetical protein